MLTNNGVGEDQRTSVPLYPDPVRRGDKLRRLPWVWFLILTTLFFIANDDIRYSPRTTAFGDNLRNLEEIDPGQTNLTLRQIGFLGLALSALALLYRMRRRPLCLERKLGTLMLGFVGIACVSAFRSDYALLTLKRLGVLFVLLLATVAYNKRLSLREVVWFALVSSFTILLIGVVAEISYGVFSPLSNNYQFSGTTGNNFTGWIAATLIMSATALSGSGSIGRANLFLILLIGVPLLLLTKSRESTIGLAISILSYWNLISGKRTVICVLWILLTLAAASYLLFGDQAVGAWKYAVLLGKTNEDLAWSLSGRLPLWKSLIGYALLHPLAGYGYGSFWTPGHIQDISREHGWVVGDAHLGYLDILLGVGIIGAALFVVIQFLVVRRYGHLYRATKQRDYAFAYSFLIFVQFNMLLASVWSISNITTFLWILLLVRSAISFRWPPTPRLVSEALGVMP